MTGTPQHKIIPAEAYIAIKLDGELTAEGAVLFQNDFEQFIKPTHHLIIQCENCSGMVPQWVRVLMAMAMELKKINRQVRVVQATPKVMQFFKDQGVDKALKCLKSLREAQVELGLATKKAIDTDFINPFLSGTMKVLEIQCKTKSIPGKIYVKKPGEKFSGDISGNIGLVSEVFTGAVTISFPEATFLQVVGRMFGETFTSITKEIEDGAGELTNIIFGQAKIQLNEKGYGIKTALPSVITGKDHSVSTTVKGVTVVVPFESDAGKFFIEITTSV